MNLSTCSCGDAHPHEVMVRQSADGKRVQLDSDGGVWVGWSRGGSVGAASARSAEGQARALAVGRMVLEWACVYDAAEISLMIQKGRKLAKVPGTLSALTEAIAPKAKAPVLSWTVISANRDGVATERQARLPRLLWPHLAVIDYCGGAHSTRGRYHLVSRDRSEGREVWRATGLQFHSLAALWAHLSE